MGSCPSKSSGTSTPRYFGTADSGSVSPPSTAKGVPDKATQSSGSSPATSPATSLAGSLADTHDSADGSVDVTLMREVIFEVLIEDDLGLDKMLEFAKQEFSEENLLFYIETRKYKKLQTEGDIIDRTGDYIPSLGRAIIGKFLCSDAEMMVNLPSHMLAGFKEPPDTGTYDYTPDLFDNAADEIRQMLRKDTFSRFKMSDHAMELIKEKPHLSLLRSSSVESTVGLGSVDITALNATMNAWQTGVACDRLTLWLVDPKSNKLYNVASTMMGNTMIGLPLGVGLAGTAAKTGNDIYVEDAYDDPNFNRSIDQATGYRTKAVCCVVLKEKNTNVAVVQVINKVHKDEVFSAADAAEIRKLQPHAMHAMEVYRKSPVGLWKRL